MPKALSTPPPATTQRSCVEISRFHFLGKGGVRNLVRGLKLKDPILDNNSLLISFHKKSAKIGILKASGA